MQLISPEKVFRGNGAWFKALPQIKKICKRTLLLGRSVETDNIRNKIYKDLFKENLEITVGNLNFDCCYEDLDRLKSILLT